MEHLSGKCVLTVPSMDRFQLLLQFKAKIEFVHFLYFTSKKDMQRQHEKVVKKKRSRNSTRFSENPIRTFMRYSFLLLLQESKYYATVTSHSSSLHTAWSWVFNKYFNQRSSKDSRQAIQQRRYFQGKKHSKNSQTLAGKWHVFEPVLMWIAMIQNTKINLARLFQKKRGPQKIVNG